MALNREQRRAIARRLKAQGRDVLVLRGGPMDGAVVPRGAPCLHPDWSATWPPTIAARERPGRYVVATGEATWRETA